MSPRPCSAIEAVARARDLVASADNARAGYALGGGGYREGWSTPWTTYGGVFGGDCRVAFLWCYKVPAERPGYNRGPWATVADCINYNSLIEDAEHGRDLVELVTDAPLEGDVIAYPTITIVSKENGVDVDHRFIGHGAIVVDVSRWNPDAPRFADLDIVQVRGPAARKPAAILSDGSVFDEHTAKWPKPQHRSKLLRVRP